MNSAKLRLMTDLKMMKNEPPEGCSASPQTDENLFVWCATVFGPPETPWEGGIYSLRLQFNENYPEKPPRVRFTSEVFHPNVYADGNLCLDIIGEKWSPIYTVCSILTSIQVGLPLIFTPINWFLSWPCANYPSISSCPVFPHGPEPIKSGKPGGCSFVQHGQRVVQEEGPFVCRKEFDLSHFNLEKAI